MKAKPLDNPYSPPKSDLSAVRKERTQHFDEVSIEGAENPERVPAISPIGTTMPRHMAAIIDSVLAAFLGVLAAKQLSDDWPVAQGICVFITYLAYFQIFEMLLSATPGKFLMGLKIIGYDGKKCSTRQILVRTLFRLLEVNPFLFGAIPAAARIIVTRDKQRFGDKFADTVVVFR